MNEYPSVSLFNEMGMLHAHSTCFFRDKWGKSFPHAFSRVGGVPQVPDSFEWPSFSGRHLNFIGQFKGSDAAGAYFGIAAGTLEKGLYYLFFDSVSFFSMKPEPGIKLSAGVRVLCFPDENADLHEPEQPEANKVKVPSPIFLLPLTLYTLPSENFRDKCTVLYSDVDRMDEYYNVLKKLPYIARPHIRLQIGGYPSRFEGLDLYPKEHFELYFRDDGLEPKDRFTLFAEFQMNLEPLCTESSQNICLWIRAKDFASRNFNKIYATIN